MKTTLTRNLAWVLGLLLLAGGIAFAKEHGLDGTSWKIHVKPEGISKDRGEKDFDETLIFANGKLMTAESSQLGFDATHYTMTKTGHEDYNFSAEQDGDNNGKYVWTGTIDDDDIKGRLVWTKEDGSVATYSFHGDKK